MPRSRSSRLLAVWLGAFFVVNAACHLSAGTNADSRLAALLAMTRDHTFRIDPYIGMTSDWARTPDGHYYSNKAPGAAFLAAIPFAIWDRIFPTTWGNKSHALKFLSYLLQFLPFLFLVALCARWLNLPPSAEATFLAAVLFGNTAALLMSTFYGHGLTAVLFLGALLALLRERYAIAGLFVGFCVLTDYGSALFVPAFLFWVARARPRALGEFLFGALPSAGLWCWYHAAAFGSPLRIANQFQNPVYQDLLHERNHLWGVLLPLPRPSILLELIAGPARGLLWTQPWVLFAALLPLWRKVSGEARRIYFLLLFCTVALLWMNASFGGWHGGLPPGPRYLAAVLPAWAVWLAWVFPGMNLASRRACRVLVTISVLFSAMVYATELSAGVTPLWPLYLNRVMAFGPSVMARLALLAVVFAFLIIFSYRSARSRVISTL